MTAATPTTAPPPVPAATRWITLSVSLVALLVVLVGCSAAPADTPRGRPSEARATTRTAPQTGSPTSSAPATHPRPRTRTSHPRRRHHQRPHHQVPFDGSCRYIPFGTSSRRVSRPPARPVTATQLVLRLRLGDAQTTRDVTIALDPASAPCAVNSMVHLARAQFYRHTACDRLSTQVIYVLQCGDLTGTGYGGPGYRFDDELPRQQHYPPGTVAMATGAPNTNGSQFFIVYRKARIAPDFTVIGHVTGGLGVIADVARHGATSVYATGDGRPKLPVHIVAATAN